MGNSCNLNKNPITMDPQIAHSFLKYQPEYHQFRQQYLKPRTLSELKSTAIKQMQQEYDTLSSADIDDSMFNMKNEKMDRYCDIKAYQHSRVKLENIPDFYINANQVRSLVDGQIFAIFSQAPVKKYDNFWQAAYYKNVSIVVMLCSFVDPKRGRQSEQYWPDSGNHASFSAEKIKITNLSCDQTDKEYIVNKFVMEGPQGTKYLTHIHWMGWSDLKKPLQHNMQKFQLILQICLQQIEKKNLIWIHCSAGIGRTGTLGGVIEAIRLYGRKKEFSIFAIVENMRKYRYHAVQTFEQYVFLYQYLCKKLGS